MNFVEYVVITLNQLESRGRTSIKKIINLYIIAAQNNKDCFFFRADSCQLYNTPEYHLYICSLGVQLVLHHPELYIERNYEYSWQNYVNDMARQGTWADNIIIQVVANSMNITINIIGKVSIRAKCGPPGQTLSWFL